MIMVYLVTVNYLGDVSLLLQILLSVEAVPQLINGCCLIWGTLTVSGLQCDRASLSYHCDAKGVTFYILFINVDSFFVPARVLCLFFSLFLNSIRCPTY